MPFNSIPFLFFLPTVFVLYWFVFKERRIQNLFIVAASYVFYGWWNWRFLFLIALTTVCCYFSGLMIESYLHSGEKKKAKAVNVCNIIVNVGILGYFKYFNFFIDSLVNIAVAVGWHIDIPTARIILPVGISFYTFQAIGYSIDVKRKIVPASHDIVSFFAYVSFFPQLVAGPIERAKNLLPQFAKERTFSYEQATDGVWQMLWGFFKKLVIADNCARYVNDIFALPSNYGSPDLFLGMVFFFFQLYCDFSGYSDIAIGTAKLFGFRLTRNFDSPEYSRNFAEFWRKWHMSLNGWFFDYIFFSMGGWNKKWRIALNVLVVFMLSGLWHGADCSFVCMGLYYGVCAIPYFVKYKPLIPAEVANGGMKPSLKEVRQMLTTLIMFIFALPLFRSGTISDAALYYKSLFVNYSIEHVVSARKSLFVFMGILLLCDWFFRGKSHPFQFGPRVHRSMKFIVLFIVFVFIFWFAAGPQGFIYFDF